MIFWLYIMNFTALSVPEATFFSLRETPIYPLHLQILFVAITYHYLSSTIQEKNIRGHFKSILCGNMQHSCSGGDIWDRENIYINYAVLKYCLLLLITTYHQQHINKLSHAISEAYIAVICKITILEMTFELLGKCPKKGQNGIFPN